MGQVELHHPTGRLNGVPRHPSLVVPLCVPCHLAEHDLWRGAGLHVEPPSPSILLGRVAIWLAAWGHSLDVDYVSGLAEVAADLAEQIEEER
jgi:hypothetical protein